MVDDMPFGVVTTVRQLGRRPFQEDTGPLQVRRPRALRRQHRLVS